jgi:uncharacterized protein
MDRMNIRGFGAVLLALGLAASATGATFAAAADKTAYREIFWNELVPKGWNPLEELRKLGPGMDVDSPQSMQAMRELWDAAPPVTTLDGSALKLPGYIVPLDSAQGGLKEFLLVPYFGACIHTPPPPANQIVHVLASTPAKGFKAMDVVWVSGRMRVSRMDSAMGVAGYRMEAAAIERYVAPARPPAPQ